MESIAKRIHKFYKYKWPKFIFAFEGDKMTFVCNNDMASLKSILGTQVFPFGLKELGLEKFSKKYLRYHIQMTSRRNESVIAYAQVLRRKGYKVIGLSKSFPALFNNNLKLSQIIKRKEFDDIINFYDLNLPKASKKTINVLMRRSKIKEPGNIIYVDDQESNLVEAKELDVHTILYKNFRQAKKGLIKIFKY